MGPGSREWLHGSGTGLGGALVLGWNWKERGEVNYIEQ